MHFSAGYCCVEWKNPLANGCRSELILHYLACMKALYSYIFGIQDHFIILYRGERKDINIFKKFLSHSGILKVIQLLPITFHFGLTFILLILPICFFFIAITSAFFLLVQIAVSCHLNNFMIYNQQLQYVASHLLHIDVPKAFQTKY